MRSETFHESWAPEHPILWESASGDERAYLTIEHAVQRIARVMDDDTRDWASILASGRTIVSPFAEYRLIPTG